MIKIENPNLDLIAQDYFNGIKAKIIQRSDYCLAICRVLFENDNIAELENHALHGKVKKTLTNFLLSKNRLVDQENYANVILSNCYDWVGTNKDILIILSATLRQEGILRRLILCPPDEALNVENALKEEAGILDVNLTDDIKGFIKNIIFYGLFDSFAYNIATRIGINTCPYCNRNYINTVIDKDGDGVIRPTFDHFFPQSRHPFLGLSFFNLIPSCYFCNSSLKSATLIALNTHLHPYLEGFDDHAAFRISIKHCKPDKSDPENYSLFFVDNTGPLLDAKYRKIFGGNQKVPNLNEGNINLFKLSEIYQSHLDIVGELVVKCDALSSGYSDSLFKMFGLLKTNRAEFYRYYFNNYYDKENFNRRPMAKLTKDVVAQVIPAFVK